MSDAAAVAAAPHEGLAMVGISHRTAPLDVLERLALAPHEIEGCYQLLFAGGAVDGAIVLSTCNRTEIYALPCDPRLDVTEVVRHALRGVAGGARVPEPRFMYEARGRASVEHLFRVTCGLDSMVLGEAQILGQVKDAFEKSRGFKKPSHVFDRVMSAALRVGKKSRADTEIGRGAVSVASAAVHLATKIYKDLSRHTVAILGAGDTGRLLAEHFASCSPRELWIVNRTLARAEGLAREHRGRASPLERLADVIGRCDILACAVQSPEPLVTRAMVEGAMQQRRGEPLALLDLGLPRNVAAEVNEITNVFVHDLEALEQVVDQNLSRRKKDVPVVEHLITDEVERLLDWQRSTQAEPLIVALRQAMEELRRVEVDKAAAGLTPEQREAVERATRAVVNKLLHGPMVSIKEFARQQEEGAEQLRLIRRIFSNLKLDP